MDHHGAESAQSTYHADTPTMMGWLRGLVWGALVVGMVSSVWATAPTVVLIQGRRVTLDAPFVNKGRVVYAPIRDIARITKSQLNYIRHLDGFQLTCPSPQVTVMVLVNDQKGLVNTMPKSLSAPTVFLESQLYVPLHEVAHWLGYDVRQVTGYWEWRRLDSLPPPSPSLTPSSKSATPSSNRVARAGVGTPRSPTPSPTIVTVNPILVKRPIQTSPESSRPMASLRAGGQTIPILEPIMVNGVLYVALDRWVDHATLTPTTWESVIGKQVLKWRVTTVTPNQGLGDWVWRHHQRIWIPMTRLSDRLGIPIQWDPSTRHVVIPTKLTGVEWRNRAQDSRVALVATLPIKGAKVQMVRDGFEVIIPDTVTPLADRDFPTGDIKRIQYKAGPNHLRVMVLTRGWMHYQGCEPKLDGCEIRVLAIIPSLNQVVRQGEWQLKVGGHGVVSPSIWTTAKGVVIDFPNSISMLPKLITPLFQSPYTAIRTSQFSINPPITRVVIDTTANLKVVWGGRGVLHLSYRSVTTNRQGMDGGGRVSQLVVPPKTGGALRRYVIVIDPGHGGGDPGGIAQNGRYEKDMTIELSRRLKGELERLGAAVVMCRNQDENPSLQERCDIAEQAKGDMLISVHINSFFHSFASGTETYYYKPSDKLLSQLVHARMVSTLGFRDNGLKRARMYVLRNTSMPAVLIEPGFITNPLEFDRLNRGDVQQKLAVAIAQGIVDYFSSNP